MERSGGGRGREPAHWSRDGKRREVLGGSDLELTLHFNTNNRSASSRIIKKVMKGRGGGGVLGGVTGEDVHVYVAAALPVRRLLSLRSFIIFFPLSLSHFLFCSLSVCIALDGRARRWRGFAFGFRRLVALAHGLIDR